MIFENVDPRTLVINEAELSSRLSSPIDIGDISGLYESILEVAKPMYAAVRVKLIREEGAILIGNERVESTALLRVLDGCDECALMVATLGVGVDRLLLKRAQMSVSEAFILDAIADALIEALCDRAQSGLGGGAASSRFSPGYADLDLSFGRTILAMTDAQRRLGINLTESGLMVPRKSVNAIVAIR